MNEAPLRVVVAEPHVFVGEALGAHITSDSGFELVAHASDADQALELVRELQPDVLLLGYQIALRAGPRLCEQLRVEAPQTATLVLAPGGDGFDPAELLDAGACGYVVLRDHGLEAVSASIRAAAAGRTVELGSDDPQAENGGANDDGLSDRELQVLSLMAQGLSNREIGSSLWISEATVKTHVSHILRKLGKSDRTQAVLYAVRSGMLGGPAPPSGP